MCSRRFLYAASLAAALLISPAAFSQIHCGRQPWSRPWASFESRVVGCQDNAPLGRVAMDDFVCDEDTTIVRLHWWGALDHPGQANRPFYVAFYLDGGDCRPGDQLAEMCVQPRARYVATDCEGRRVFRFSARLATPFTAIAGDRYWLQISEADEESVRPGVEDFRWSSHRPIRGCPAGQRDAAGGFNSPLLDACDDKEEDLAFVLISKSITGTIILPNLRPPVLVLNLFSAAPLAGDDGLPQETLIVEPDANGEFDIPTSVPDGTYQWELYGMSAKPVTGEVTVAEGQESGLGGGPLSGGAIEPDIGDTDTSGSIDVIDLLNVLGHWG